MTLTAIDLFCGAGGFTEGFRQMGFRVQGALDNWSPAVETHRRNHPDTEVIAGDILEVDPDVLPRVDVLIGSPPCTEFSFANRGGGGDVAAGMKLVLRFLRFVHELQPKYWIMENVPRLIETLPSRVSLRDLGVDRTGYLDIPVREVLNSADYGVPQKRLRLVSGRYPVPERTHADTGSVGSFAGMEPWVPMSRVLESLPDPLSDPVPRERVKDPNYDFSLPATQLTDHFMDTALTQEEVRLNRKAKTDHSWYGKMSFPDPVDRPARTVMATQLSISRETTVLETRRNGRVAYRRPTIRECASFSSFPISYQFWGATAAIRYKLVGNAVPPGMAAALARAVLMAEGLKPPTPPSVTTSVVNPAPPLNHSPRPVIRRRGRLPLQRRFRDHIPGSRAEGCRVDIDNMGEHPAPHPFARTLSEGHWVRVPHLRQWSARLYVGSGDGVVSVTPSLEQTLSQLAASGRSEKEMGRLARFVKTLAGTLPGWLPDATSLQGAWAERTADTEVTPSLVLERLAGIVEKHFPAKTCEGVRVPVVEGFPVVPRQTLPLRACAFLVAGCYAAEIVNESDLWIARHWSRQFRPETWSIVGAPVRSGAKFDARGRILLLYSTVARVIESEAGARHSSRATRPRG